METQSKEKLVMDVEEVADLLKLSGRALRMRVMRGRGAPQPLRLGGRLMWRKEDVVAWLDQEAQRQGVAYSGQGQESS